MQVYPELKGRGHVLPLDACLPGAMLGQFLFHGLKTWSRGPKRWPGATGYISFNAIVRAKVLQRLHCYLSFKDCPRILKCLSWNAKLYARISKGQFTVKRDWISYKEGLLYWNLTVHYCEWSCCLSQVLNLHLRQGFKDLKEQRWKWLCFAY